ncbi:MAG: hypothetical protein ABIL16_06955 [candidate division WOR-3 bacterium]
MMRISIVQYGGRDKMHVLSTSAKGVGGKLKGLAYLLSSLN